MTRPTHPGLPAMATEIVASLAQHRALSTPQVRAIHLPDHGARWTQRVLHRIASAGLIAYVENPRPPRRLWFATEPGARLAREAGALDGEPRLLGADEAAGPLQAHTLAVNDAAISFLVEARERGDDFGPLSWRHEVAHRLSGGRGRRRQTLFADALLTYLRLTDEEVVVEQRFLELDRATLSVDRLAAQLGRYAQLYRARGEGEAEQLWRSSYPVFPPVLCVLAGAGRAVLERRRDTAIALLRSNPDLSRSPEVSIRFCLADDLAARGPFAPIFVEVRRPREPVDWLIAEGR
jgi:Replication-relaxation